MDVTLITELFRTSFDGRMQVQKVTRDTLFEINADRNVANHSSENEEDDELYLRGLLALCNLKNFVRTVDKYETEIADETRLAYRHKYIQMIEKMKKLLDDERIELIQRERNIQEDVQRVLDSDDPRKTWLELIEIYWNRYYKIEKNIKVFDEFVLRASDARIPFAHPYIIDMCFCDEDYKEFERRLFMLYEDSKDQDTYRILNSLNGYIRRGNSLTEGMLKIVNGLSERGCVIKKNDDGTYVI